MEPLPCQRELFELPAEVTYLNCAYMSPLLRASRLAGCAGLERQGRPWEIGPADWFNEVDRARGLAARLLNADLDGVALVPAASYGLAVAARNLDLERGTKILNLHAEFPSNRYPWVELGGRCGASIEEVGRPGDGDWTSAVVSQVDARTSLIAVPNCHWEDGTLIDLERVGAAARAVGAALVVDATQSLGAHPLDVQRVQPDYVVSASYKWLLGPYGTGLLYAAPEHRHGAPIEHNWINRVDSEDFAQLGSYSEELRPGARRFDAGARSNWALLPAFIAALEQILDWGVTAIAATLGRLTQRIEGRARERGHVTVDRRNRVAHTIGVKVRNADAVRIVESLGRERVHVSARGHVLRVSPHLYNDEEDIERLFAAIDRTTNRLE